MRTSEKCMYLGHVITEDGVKTDPGKIKAVAEFKTSKNEKEKKRLHVRVASSEMSPCCI